MLKCCDQKITDIKQTVCSLCGKMYSISERNFLELIGGEKNLLLTETELEEKFWRIMADFHPDKHIATANFCVAEKNSIIINKVYNAIQSVEGFIELISRLENYDLDTISIKDTNFLAQCFAWQESTNKAKAYEEAKKMYEASQAILKQQLLEKNSLESIAKNYAMLQMLKRVLVTTKNY